MEEAVKLSRKAPIALVEYGLDEKELTCKSP